MISIAFLVVLLSITEAYCSDDYCTSVNQIACWAKENPNANRSFVTTSTGRVYPTMLASQSIGKWGPTLLRDVYLLERLQKFNRERIPPRVAHAKGAGAHGYFRVTHDVSKYTKAAFLQPGKQTKVFVRFSAQLGELGSADTIVDAKGFAVKFYTEEGNYDFVGLNLPVFGNRDAMILPDLTHTRIKNAQTHLRDHNASWDLASERPETMIFILFFFSKTAYVKSYRYIDGFAVHTFNLVNRNNEPIFAKLILSSDATDKSYFTTPEALTTAGFYPEFLTQELYDKIATKQFPTWTMNLQLMTYEQAKSFPYSPFDPTKYWNTTEFPLIPVGKLVLNENPHNFFNEVEQVAFSPSHLVPGIEPTPDRILEARMFSYPDAQVYRLGVNHNQLPINRCPMGQNNYDRDGFMNYGDTKHADGPNYNPNTFNGPISNNDNYFNELPFGLHGTVDRIDLKDEDNFSLCKEYLNSLSDADERALLANMAFSLINVDPRITQKVMDNLVQPISPDLVTKLKLALQQIKSMPK